MAIATARRVASMSLQEIRAIRKACAETTPEHRPWPNTCPRCDLGIAFLPNGGPQEQFVSSDVRELLYGGQAGGGKSIALVAIPLRWVSNPKFNGIILRRDTTQLAKLLREADSLYPKAIGVSLGDLKRMRGDAAIYRFPSGATIRYEHCQFEDDIARYDGDEFQYVGFDELTHFTKKQFVGVNARIRSPDADLPRYSRSTSNPGGEGHAWVFDRWGAWLNPKAQIAGMAERHDPESGARLPPARPGEVLWFHPETDERVPKGALCGPDQVPAISRTFIPAALSDNPVLAVNDPGYRANLMTMDAVRRAQLLRGDWLAKPGRGVYFQRGWFRMSDVKPTDVVARVRVWDLAATEVAPGKKQKSDPDWTVGEKWAKTKDGGFFVENIVRFRGRPLEVDETILNTAKTDGKEVTVRLPQDPGQAGVAQKAHFIRMLAGFTVRIRPVNGDKVTRAGPFSSQAEGKAITVLEAPWNTAFFEELEAFPEGTHDDQVDAGSDAIAELAGDLPWSEDLGEYSGPKGRFNEEETAAGADAANPEKAWAKPSTHSSDTDKIKRRGRW